MSSVARMPTVGQPPVIGRVIKVHRMPGHYVDDGEPVIDLRVERHILTICSPDEGRIIRSTWFGSLVNPGDVVIEVTDAGSPTYEIFVAYRRADAPGHAGRVGERLIRDFGRGQVFKDLEALRPGEDFVEAIRRMLHRAVAMVVVIGPHWLTLTNDVGVCRLNDPDDLHREEMRTAFQRRIPVFPVLVNGARIPTAGELPEDIHQLTRQYAVEITDARWDYDVGRLSEAVTAALWRSPTRHIGLLPPAV